MASIDCKISSVLPLISLVSSIRLDVRRNVQFILIFPWSSAFQPSIPKSNPNSRFLFDTQRLRLNLVSVPALVGLGSRFATRVSSTGRDDERPYNWISLLSFLIGPLSISPEISPVISPVMLPRVIVPRIAPCTAKCFGVSFDDIRVFEACVSCDVCEVGNVCDNCVSFNAAGSAGSAGSVGSVGSSGSVGSAGSVGSSFSPAAPRCVFVQTRWSFPISLSPSPSDARGAAVTVVPSVRVVEQLRSEP